MKTNARILFGLGVFFFLALIGYVVSVYTLTNDTIGLFNHQLRIEPVGTTVIAMAVGMAWFPAFFLFKAAKSTGNKLPEDEEFANIDEADPDYGFYSPWSWWPFVMAAAAGVLFMGLAVGPWLAVIGGVLMLVAIIGFSFEYHRGRLAH